MSGVRHSIRLAVLAAFLGSMALVTLTGCGSSETARPGPAATVTETGVQAKYAGTAVSPPRQAPPLVLEDSLGRKVRLRDYRGKVVLLTFLYTNCPDICPLIASNLRVVQAELGSAATDVQIVAVSTDPRGDTPAAVNAFLKAHRMTGRMEYLIGSRKQLAPVWKSWYVDARPVPGPDKRIGHSQIVYGIAPRGEIRATYPGDFKPAQIVHDVPLLAEESG